MRLTKFNPETGQYEFHKAAKTQAEFNEQRKAVIQKLGEYEDKASDVAKEIFAEIEFEIHQLDFDREETRAIAIEGIIANAKKKYIGKDTNVTTKESEKDNG
jgi:hypothetical protein